MIQPGIGRPGLIEFSGRIVGHAAFIGDDGAAEALAVIARHTLAVACAADLNIVTFLSPEKAKGLRLRLGHVPSRRCA